MNLELNQKKALVFGGSGGMGLGITAALYAESTQIAVSSRDVEKHRNLKEKFKGIEVIRGDLNQPGDAERVVRQAQETLKGLNILVINTASPPTGTFETTTLAMWNQGVQGLLLSTVEAIQTALPEMKKNGHGRIILIASTSAREPIPTMMVSTGIRSGLLGLMKGLSTEVASYGITVNTILPGLIETQHLMDLGTSKESLIKHVPAGKLGQPEDIGNLVAFLASSKAQYITGQAIACDGGRMKST